MTRLEYAPRIDRAQVRVRCDDAHVLGQHAQLLRHDHAHDRARPLADVVAAGERRHQAGPVDLQLDAGLRHLVRVDRVVRAGDVHRARDADAATERQLAVALLPVARALDRFQTLHEATRGDALVVDRAGVRALVVLAADLDGIHAELLGDLVELDLEGEARLYRSVTALRPARRLVREDPRRVEAVGRKVVGSREQLAGVVGRHQAVGAVRAAVDDDARVHARQPPVPGRAALVAHLHRVPAAVRVEDLLARPQHLHRAPRQHRELRDAELERERIGFSAERAAERGLDHAHARLRQLQHAGERAVHVVRDLRRGPHREHAVRAVLRDGAVRLHRRVGRAVERVLALHHDVGAVDRGVDLAELQVHVLRDVTVLAVLGDCRFGAGQGLVRVEMGLEDRVFDLDQLQRVDGRVLVEGRDRGDGLADVAHLVHGERRLVLGPGQDAEFYRQIGADDDREHPGQRAGAAGVDGLDDRVRMRAAQQLRVQHARQLDVVGVDRRAGRLAEAVDLALRLANDREVLAPGRAGPVLVTRCHQILPDGGPWPPAACFATAPPAACVGLALLAVVDTSGWHSCATNSTASMICV